MIKSYSLTMRSFEVPVLANECVLDELLISPYFIYK